MEADKDSPCTLSAFIHFCTNCNERIKVNGEWVKTNRRRSFHFWFDKNCTKYEILNVVLDAHNLVFHLQTKDGLVYKSFSIYEVGWTYNTYGCMTFLYRDANGKNHTWTIS